MKTFIPTVLALFALGCIAGHCAACSGPSQAAATAAESAYTAELLRCVDTAKTLAESRSCRQSVDARWGITEKEARTR